MPFAGLVAPAAAYADDSWPRAFDGGDGENVSTAVVEPAGPGVDGAYVIAGFSRSFGLGENGT